MRDKIEVQPVKAIGSDPVVGNDQGANAVQGLRVPGAREYPRRVDKGRANFHADMIT